MGVKLLYSGFEGVLWFGPAAPKVLGAEDISNPDFGAILKKGALL